MLYVEVIGAQLLLTAQIKFLPVDEDDTGCGKYARYNW